MCFLPGTALLSKQLIVTTSVCSASAKENVYLWQVHPVQANCYLK